MTLRRATPPREWRGHDRCRCQVVNFEWSDGILRTMVNVYDEHCQPRVIEYRNVDGGGVEPMMCRSVPVYEELDFNCYDFGKLVE